MTKPEFQSHEFQSPALLDWLDQPTKQELLSRATLIKLNDGTMIHGRGNTQAGIAIIKSGHVKIGVNGLDGTFIGAGLLGPGETFGEFTIFTSLPRTHDIWALGNLEIYRVEKSHFLALCKERPNLLSALLSATLIRSHILLELLDAMRRLPLDQKIARLILSLTASSKTNSACVRLRQSDLASSLGTSRVSLGKAVKSLTEKSLIELGYGEISIPSKQALYEWLQSTSTTPLRY